MILNISVNYAGMYENKFTIQNILHISQSMNLGGINEKETYQKENIWRKSLKKITPLILLDVPSSYSSVMIFIKLCLGQPG